MNSDSISTSILNELEDVVYISDPKTYELYYLNASGLRTLGNPPEEQWRRKMCYEVLQGRKEPCPFCTNDQLCHQNFYNWEHYNALLDTYFDIQDKLVDFQGVEARLEIAKDVTRRKHLEQDLERRLEEQSVLNSCISLLHTADTPEVSINKLLALVAQYHNAERGYIFLLRDEDSKVDNTHEWCAEGVEPQIEMLQDMDSSIVGHWFEKYREVGEFYIDSLTQELDPDSDEYMILDSQGIQSLVTAPLRNTEGVITGFLGVDNPKKHAKNTYVIRAVSNVVDDFLDKSAQLEMLNRLSFYDNLTGLKNRHSYSNKIAELREKPPATLGVIYADINGLKYTNDVMGHAEGDALLKELSEILYRFYEGSIYRIGGDEFVIICTDMTHTDYEARRLGLANALHGGDFPKAALGCCWREGDCSVEEQIEIADHLMQEEKINQYQTYADKTGIFRSKLHNSIPPYRTNWMEK